jgi:hypothetical protein
VVQTEFSGDYSEAFEYWTDTHVSDRVREGQKNVAADLRELTDSAPAGERESLEHITRHVEFMTHYAEAWIQAQALNEVLKRAVQLRKDGKKDEAKALVRGEGLPIWMKIAPEVRQVFLRFHGAIATRNDVGTLASMHNKFERIALERLPLSMAEFFDEMPAEVGEAVEKARQPDTETPPRLIVPVRPTMLARGEKVRLLAIVAAPGPVQRVTLRLRAAGASSWNEYAMRLLGRKTWEGWLELPASPSPVVEYDVVAEAGGETLRAPGKGTFRITVDSRRLT